MSTMPKGRMRRIKAIQNDSPQPLPRQPAPTGPLPRQSGKCAAADAQCQPQPQRHGSVSSNAIAEGRYSKDSILSHRKDVRTPGWPATNSYPDRGYTPQPRATPWGQSPKNGSSPNGAQWRNQTRRDVHCAPVGLNRKKRPNSQGVALGCNRAPRWGFGRAKFAHLAAMLSRFMCSVGVGATSPRKHAKVSNSRCPLQFLVASHAFAEVLH